MFTEPGRVRKSFICPSIARRVTRLLILWGRKHFRNYPWRKTKDPWHGLVAEILLQRTRAINVIPVYEHFIKRFPTPSDLAYASVEEIIQVIHPLGLRWRAPLLKQLGVEIQKKGGKIPRDIENLKKLPGVGDYVAAAWLSFHGGERSVIIDANVVRFLCRLTGKSMDGETRRQKWLIRFADYLTPAQAWKTYNYAILDFSMEICNKQPECFRCPIGPKLCKFGMKKQNKNITKRYYCL